jgi:hypothetical protein
MIYLFASRDILFGTISAAVAGTGTEHLDAT